MLTAFSFTGISEALVQSHELISTTVAGRGKLSTSTTSVATGIELTATYLGSTEDKITLLRLLPALPTAWALNSGGFAKGLRARGASRSTWHGIVPEP